MYKLSKHKEETPRNLIDIPVEEKPTKCLFNDVELYKIIGTIDQPQTPSSQPSSSLDEIFGATNQEEHKVVEHEPQKTNDLNLYKLFVGFRK